MNILHRKYEANNASKWGKNKTNTFIHQIYSLQKARRREKKRCSVAKKNWVNYTLKQFVYEFISVRTVNSCPPPFNTVRICFSFLCCLVSYHSHPIWMNTIAIKSTSAKLKRMKTKCKIISEYEQCAVCTWNTNKQTKKNSRRKRNSITVEIYFLLLWLLFGAEIYFD